MDCCAKANMSTFSRDENVSKAFFSSSPICNTRIKAWLGSVDKQAFGRKNWTWPIRIVFSWHCIPHIHTQARARNRHCTIPISNFSTFQSWMNLASAYKSGSWKSYMLYFALLHNKSGCWCTRRRRYSLLFSTLLPKISFSRRKLFNYRFSVVAEFKDAFSLLLFCLQTHFCVTSLPNLLLHLWPLGLCTESAAVILCETSGECIQNIPELFCFDSVDGAVDWLGWVDLGYKAPFVGRSSSLIRSADMFRTRSRLKDTRWHLLLCPGVWCTWPLRQWSFIINHSHCLGTLKPELEETW